MKLSRVHQAILFFGRPMIPIGRPMIPNINNDCENKLQKVVQKQSFAGPSRRI